MNYFQILAFFVFVLSTYILGSGCYYFLNRQNKNFINQSVYFGETLLLGSSVLIGQMMILSFLGLYRGPFLWGMVLLNFSLLCNKNIRQKIPLVVSLPKSPWLPSVIFIFLLIIFVFRNSYFLVDIDSHRIYLFAQKVWLSKGTSIFTDATLDARIYIPHFDAVPYSLGISLFGKETLFCQFINVFWRAICLFLVFGYVSYRFTAYHGLGAAMLLLFNDHFFFSGANQWVAINGAIIGLLFSISYNLVEARRENSLFRLSLALAFLPQLMANKYQMAYIFIFFLFFMFVVIPGCFGKIRKILADKYYVAGIVVSCVFALLWYVKNFLATGVPVFPVFAGNFNALGWTPEMSEAFMQVFRGLKPTEFLKYASFLFIWPGVQPGKISLLILFFLPLIFMGFCLSKKFDQERFFELCYWLTLAFFITMGICMASHQDPRYYRFPIGIYIFVAVFALDLVLGLFFGLKRRILVGLIIMAVSVSGYKIVFSESGAFLRPSIQDNARVLLNKLHVDDILVKHYPHTVIAIEEYRKNGDKNQESAWNIDSDFSSFLLPQRPQLSLWNTTIVSWSSYESKEKIVADLKAHDIQWVISPQGEEVQYLTAEEYAQTAVTYDRYPKQIYYPYDFPPELTRTKFLMR